MTTGTATERDQDVFLLCPYSDEEVEAFRLKCLHARRWDAPQEAARHADNPQFDPFTSTHHMRRMLFRAHVRQEMQQAVAAYYGWPEWSDDPWGEQGEFVEWLYRVPDNEMAVWAINETKGRFYLAHGTLANIRQIDFVSQSVGWLCVAITLGEDNERLLKRYIGTRSLTYPSTPFPIDLINKRIGKVYPHDVLVPGELDDAVPNAIGIMERWLATVGVEEGGETFALQPHGPLLSYVTLVRSIYLCWHAVKYVHDWNAPEARYLVDLSISTSPRLTQLFEEIAPEGMEVPDEAQSRFGVARHSLDGTDRWFAIKGRARKLAKTLGLGHEDVLAEVAQADAYDAIEKQVERIMKRPEDLLDRSKKFLTKNAIRQILRSEEADTWRGENKAYYNLRERVEDKRKPETALDRQLLKLELSELWAQQPEHNLNPLSLNKALRDSWDAAYPDPDTSAGFAKRWKETTQGSDDEGQAALIERVSADALPPFGEVDWAAWEEDDAVFGSAEDLIPALVEHAGLTPKQRRVLELCKIEGRSGEEAASILAEEFGEPSERNDVYQLFSRAKRRLAGALNASRALPITNVPASGRLERQLERDPASVRFAKGTGSFRKGSSRGHRYVMSDAATEYLTVFEALHRATSCGAIAQDECRLVRWLYQGPLVSWLTKGGTDRIARLEDWDTRWEDMAKRLKGTVGQLEVYVDGVLAKASAVMAQILVAEADTPVPPSLPTVARMAQEDVDRGTIRITYHQKEPLPDGSETEPEPLCGMDTGEFGRLLRDNGVDDNLAASSVRMERRTLRMSERRLEGRAADEWAKTYDISTWAARPLNAEDAYPDFNFERIDQEGSARA